MWEQTPCGRLLIADYAGGEKFHPTPVFRKEVIARLGEGFSSRGALSPEAMGRALAALRDFKKSIAERETNKIIAVATSVVRDARNGKDFIDNVREQTEIEIILISGETEANLACQGAVLPVCGSGFQQRSAAAKSAAQCFAAYPFSVVQVRIPEIADAAKRRPASELRPARIPATRP